jgi:hypothetical protein
MSGIRRTRTAEASGHDSASPSCHAPLQSPLRFVAVAVAVAVAVELVVAPRLGGGVRSAIRCAGQAVLVLSRAIRDLIGGSRHGRVRR